MTEVSRRKPWHVRLSEYEIYTTRPKPPRYGVELVGLIVRPMEDHGRWQVETFVSSKYYVYPLPIYTKLTIVLHQHQAIPEPDLMSLRLASLTLRPEFDYVFISSHAIEFTNPPSREMFFDQLTPHQPGQMTCRQAHTFRAGCCCPDPVDHLGC